MKKYFPLILIISFLVITSCTSNKYAYQSTALISGLNIKVGLVQYHPFLAEYERIVLIDNKIKINFGIDGGGSSHINVFDLDNELVLQTFWSKLLVIDKSTKKHSFERRQLRHDELDHFIGKFHFVHTDKYGFTSKEQDPKFSSKLMKGG